MVFGKFRRNKPEEVARQDVMMTQNGPIELYRRDQNGQVKRIPRELVQDIQYGNPREPQQRRFRPMHTSHGPGLYRNHTMALGDKLEFQKYNRLYIYHRPPFDWYNNNRSNLIDDIEEILEPSNRAYEFTHGNPRGHPRCQDQNDNHHYNYDPKESYGRRKQPCPQKSKSHHDLPKNDADDTIYIVKKKDESGGQHEAPIYTTPEVIHHEQPVNLKPIIKTYENNVQNKQKTMEMNTNATFKTYNIDYTKYNNVISQTSTQLPPNTTGQAVIYHGKSN